ncbi:MAG: hypothetical protein JO257_32615 [Deltaproteobacteria bacterium]|nr:hypothetical protein [Deltaproteobacteria bacterium]
MMTWLIKNRLAAFEKRWGYDVSYMRDLLAADSKAFWAFARVAKISDYRRDVPLEPWFAAKLVGAMHEDCGPCTQLVVGMALAQRCTQTVIGNVIAGDDVALPDDVRLAVQFARAVLAHSAEADPLRETIVQRWGARGLVSLSLAITSARLYPTLKYALGHGRSCMRVTVGDRQIAPRRGMVAA